MLDYDNVSYEWINTKQKLESEEEHYETFDLYHRTFDYLNGNNYLCRSYG